MRRLLTKFALAFAVAALLTGCSQQPSPAPEPTPEPQVTLPILPPGGENSGGHASNDSPPGNGRDWRNPLDVGSTIPDATIPDTPSPPQAAEAEPAPVTSSSDLSP